MIRAIVLAFAWAIILTVAALPPHTMAQTSVPQLLAQSTLPSSRDIKYPDVAVAGDTAHAAGGNGDQAIYWAKTDTATDFPRPAGLGAAGGRPDYANAAVGVGPDGTVAFAWINQEDRQILFRQKPPGQDWGPTRTVISGGRDFRVEVDVGISTDRTIFVVWRSNESLVYRTSRDGGASWNEVDDVSASPVFANITNVATGPNNQVLVAYTSGVNDRLTVFAANWNGRSFNQQPLAVGALEGASPSAAISGTGVAYVSWRAVEGGVFFAERKPGEPWQISKLIDDAKVENRTSISADAQNNVHIFWTSSIARGPDLYYAFRPAGGAFAPQPIRVAAGGGQFFNVNSATILRGGIAYAHVVVERFGGSDPNVRYFLFSGAGGGITAQPQVEADAALVGNRSAVTVSFTNVFGSPNQIRWRWGAVPTDAANDSNGWQPFANPLAIAVPPNVNTSDCLPEALFTQVRSTTANAIQQEAKQDTIIIDNAVSGAVRVLNPYNEGALDILGSAAQLVDLSSDLGASNGDPDYTRVPGVYVEIGGAAECSGLKDFALSRDGGTFGAPYAISNDLFANIAPLPNLGTLSPGAVPLTIKVADEFGNQANFTRNLVYDPVKPVLTSGVLALTTPDPRASIIATLTFSNVTVTDNLYPGGYWGVWVANSRAPVADPASSPQLTWTPRAVPSKGANPTVANWSLTSGLKPDQVTPGAYYVYVRFLDGAGNPTDGVLQAQINLTTITLPATRMPLVRR